ncbi:MAG: sulfite exporter TauE/SafE family protein [Gallionella sp.]|jgi:hypothetical protein|nr:sulfite exporter TauE/SafE family protein [Gallionella sp.]
MIDAGYALAGALTGFLVGVTGVGGGALMTPLLLLVFGVAPTTAIATDLWFAALTKIVGASIHQRAGQVDWAIVKRLWTGSLPMALLVVIAIAAGEKIHKVDWLNQAIGTIVVITAVGMLFASKLMEIARNKRTGTHAQHFKRLQPPLTILAGVMLGVIVALTSIGAGALGSVLLVYLYPLRMTPHRLIATDLVHAIPLAMVAGMGYLIAGKVDGMMLASLLSGSIPAVILGSLLAGRISADWVKRALAIVLIAIGVKTLLG